MEAKTGRKKRSLVWRYFTRLKDKTTGEYSDFAKCSLCKPSRLLRCRGMTTGLIRHLLTIHGVGRKVVGGNVIGTGTVTPAENETGSADRNNGRVEVASVKIKKEEVVKNSLDEEEDGDGPSRPESGRCSKNVTTTSSRKRRSKAWKYFKVCRSSKEIAKCKLCSKFIRCTRYTSSLLRHIENYHQDVKGLRDLNDKDFELEETDDESYSKSKMLKKRSEKPYTRRSLAWKYFKTSKRKVNFSKCKLCNEWLKASGGSTTSLRRHLLVVHEMALESVRDLENHEDDLESLQVQVEETDDEPRESDSEAEGDSNSKEVEEVQRQNEGVYVKSEPISEQPEEMEEDDYFNDARPASPFESEREPSSPPSPKSSAKVGSDSKLWNYFVCESKNRAVCKLCSESFKANDNLELKLGTHARNFHRIKHIQTGKFLSEATPPIRKGVPCFICFGREKGNGPEPEVSEDSLEDSLMVMFALTKIIGVESSDLQTFLKRSGGRNPNEWVKLCGLCKTLVSEAYQLDKKIKVLAKTTIGRMRETQAESLAQEKFFDAGEFFVTKEVRRILSRRLASRSSVNSGTPTPAQTVDEEAEFGDDVCDGSSDKESFDEIPRETNETSLESKTKTTPQPQEPDTLTSSSSESNLYFSCPTCPRLGAMEFNAFLQHLIFHQKRPRKCSECSAYLPQKEELIQQHWQVFHASNIDSFLGPKSVEAPMEVGSIWKCGTCDTRFQGYEERDDHERREHHSVVAMDAACTECPLKFRSVDEVRLHKALVHPAHASLNCFYCDESFSYTTTDGTRVRDLDEVKVHIRSNHLHLAKYAGLGLSSSDLNQIITTRPAALMQECPLCGMIFRRATPLKLTRHLEREHHIKDSTKLFPCPICSKEITPWNQWSHLRTLHGQPSVCDLCGEEMKALELPPHKYKVHGVVPEGHKLYKCEKGGGCDYETLKPRYLRVHYNNFHGDKTNKLFACQFCGKRFHKLCYLTKHESIHANAKTRPFKCDLCGAGFAVKEYVHIHKRTTHERRYYPSALKKRKLMGSGSQARTIQGKVESQVENILTSSPSTLHIDPPPGTRDRDLTVAGNGTRFQDSGEGGKWI